MLLSDKDGNAIGIKCDLTGQELRKRFHYYSLSGKKISVDVSRNAINPGEVELDLDICEDALKELAAEISANYAPLKSNAIKCDLTGEYFTGKFDYWHVIFTKVTVNVEDPNNPLQTETEVLDINIGTKAFEKLNNQKHTMRLK